VVTGADGTYRLAHALLTADEVTWHDAAPGTGRAHETLNNGTPYRTLPSSKTTEVEPTEEEAGGSALVPYTSGSTSSPSPERPTSASSAKQRAQLLYIPPAIKRGFLLLARYYSLPTSPPPPPNTASVLNFLHSFIQVNNSIPLSPIAPRADIEERLLDDTIRWANVRGLRFADPRLALVPQSLQPVHQAALLPSQPVHQALVSLQPVHQAALLPFQPVHQALVPQLQPPVHQAALPPFEPVHQALVPQSLQPVHQAAPLPSQPVHQATSRKHRGSRRLQIQYDLPAGVDAVPGSPGTVLIPLQVENSSKKRKVRLRLAATATNLSRDLAPALSESDELPDAGSESSELPDAVSELSKHLGTPQANLSHHTGSSTSAPLTLPEAHRIPHEVPTDQFKILSLADKMAEETLTRRPGSPAGSLDEFDDTPEQLSKLPFAIGGTQSEVAQGKQPAYQPHSLARHGYRQPLAIPESEEDDSMEDGRQHQHPTPQPYHPPQQALQQLQQQQPPQPQATRQQYQMPQQPPQQQQSPQLQAPQQLYQVQQPPFQQYQYPPQPHYDAAASIAQSTAAMNAVAAQMANLATTLVQNQANLQGANTGFRTANTLPPNDAYGPALKPGDVATFEPRSQSDSDAASRFIDCIRDAVAHYGELRTRAVLRRCCKGPVAEHWIAGVSDHDRALLRLNCQHWTDILECDFMPYLASRLSAARAEAFHWNQGRTPAEYVAKKLRLLRKANVVRDDEVVEELHRGFAAAPNLHLHLDKYVTEVGNSISEYRRAVVRLQDSARREGYTVSQPCVGTCRPPFRDPSGNLSSNISQPHAPAEG